MIKNWNKICKLTMSFFEALKVLRKISRFLLRLSAIDYHASMHCTLRIHTGLADNDGTIRCAERNVIKCAFVETTRHHPLCRRVQWNHQQRYARPISLWERRARTRTGWPHIW